MGRVNVAGSRGLTRPEVLMPGTWIYLDLSSPHLACLTSKSAAEAVEDLNLTSHQKEADRGGCGLAWLLQVIRWSGQSTDRTNTDRNPQRITGSENNFDVFSRCASLSLPVLADEVAGVEIDATPRSMNVFPSRFRMSPPQNCRHRIFG